ncbi:MULTISPECIES: aminoglycoside phosphotransferase family protein [unclassified Virgibacillus]|uniref:phosphotransferase family protein n=1 Tax=unclassified Virgibacillus TaxID=2620237 RepID=UPI0024DE5E27|nr:aminoglycoside phosphotransferase family protein [Virgibacillus sp. LDC-1]
MSDVMDFGEPIARGNTACIYLHEGIIYKLFNARFSASEAMYEAAKQKQVLNYGICAPRILDVTTVDGKPAILMEYVNGKTLGHLFVENKAKAEHYVKLSIDVQQQMHQVYAPAMEAMSVKLKRQINNTSQLEEHEKQQIIAKMDALHYESKLCHGDFHLFNLIKSGSSVTIIDWVDSSAGDVRADVCRTYLLYLSYSTDLAESYLFFYCKKSGYAREEILQWMPIIAAARLSENVPSESAERLLTIIRDAL